MPPTIPTNVFCNHLEKNLQISVVRLRFRCSASGLIFLANEKSLGFEDITIVSEGSCRGNETKGGFFVFCQTTGIGVF